MTYKNKIDVAARVMIAIYLSVLLAIFVGWVMNLIDILSTEPFVMSGLMVARIAGIFIVPLGAVLGFAY